MGNWMPGFIVQATRGVVREQTARRKLMFTLLAIAVIMLVSGSTFLQETLDHRAHAAWFILYWLVCGWLTVTALLLSLFDMLIIRAQARASRDTFKARIK